MYINLYINVYTWSCSHPTHWNWKRKRPFLVAPHSICHPLQLGAPHSNAQFTVPRNPPPKCSWCQGSPQNMVCRLPDFELWGFGGFAFCLVQKIFFTDWRRFGSNFLCIQTSWNRNKIWNWTNSEWENVLNIEIWGGSAWVIRCLHILGTHGSQPVKTKTFQSRCCLFYTNQGSTVVTFQVPSGKQT